MNLPQKAVLSLIVSVVLVAAFSLFAVSGLFDLVETRFYSPRIVASLDREVEALTQTITTLFDELGDRCASTLEDGAVKRSFLPQQKAEDTFERAKLYSLLMNSLPGLRTVRFVDAGGSRIYFSTLDGDVLDHSDSVPSYRSYRDCPGVLPYSNVETGEGQPPRIIFDDSGEQVIFSYPFFDSFEVYRGSALFTFSARAVTDRLIRQGQVKAGEDLVLVDSPKGFLLGLPATETGNLKREAAAAAWRDGLLTLFMPDHRELESLVLVSAQSETGFFVGRLVQESILVLPSMMRFILPASFFLTTFLLIFLIFSLRQDSVTVIRTRLKQLQISLMREYRDTKGDMDWKHWSRELKQRREDIRLELKRGLPRGKHENIDALIDRSWDELIAFSIPPTATTETAAVAGEPEKPEEPEELEELFPVEDSLEEAAIIPEDAEVVEDRAENTLPHSEQAGKTLRETIVTSEAFANKDNGEVVTELEELENGPVPTTPEELAALASRIEFGPDSSSPTAVFETADATADTSATLLSIPDDAETPDGEDESPELDLSSPFESLSFESPDFSAFDAAGGTPGEDPAEAPPSRRKKQQAERRNDSGGLEEISEEGGLPLIYRPLQFRPNKPTLLRPLAEPGDEPVQEQDGIHLVNSDILDPTQETTRELDPKFLRLVESIIRHEPPTPQQ
ncbi:MAG: hypothetical protein LBU00_00545 [Treponema sp.]|jgi:hypothetical protein|nr:hypothetical protein [Treponema sp.]